MDANFINTGLEFFKTCNAFFAGVKAFFSNPMLYISGIAYNVFLLIAVVAIFAKGCGFNSGKWISGGTIGAAIFKVLTILSV